METIMGLLATLAASLIGSVKGKFGVAGGIASLDENGVLKSEQIPPALKGGVRIIDTLDASSGVAPAVPGAGNVGYTWIITSGGTIGGVTVNPGDWLVITASGWRKQEGQDLGTLSEFNAALDAAWAA